ncbi:hypothetical protein H9P43_004953 [Blastocladiella emersonii ATCC 22665]|nr:hypothetical protein H9P43_004953 [Blastocladiella emersonii ATCC 22665]
MGNTSSTTIDPARKGYHVLKVRDASPAYDAGLLSYFHFIVAVNGQSLARILACDNEPALFPNTIKASVDRPVTLTIFSGKTNDYADITLTPRWWADERDGLLGCSIRYCDYAGALMHVWHIVEVLPNSPASLAGLNIDSDYIVGTPELVLREQQELYALLASRAAENKPVRLFVYSTVHRAVRDVVLHPRRDWGGEGLIGAELGYGALHKIPVDEDSQYEDTDDELRNDPLAPATVPPPALAPAPAAAAAASPVPVPPQDAEPLLPESNPADLQVLAEIPSFAAPAPSKYARTLATGLPTGPVEVKPATEYAGLAAPPTDAVLAKARRSVDLAHPPILAGSPVGASAASPAPHDHHHHHGSGCGHDHDHHHHPAQPPMQQQQYYPQGPSSPAPTAPAPAYDPYSLQHAPSPYGQPLYNQQQPPVNTYSPAPHSHAHAAHDHVHGHGCDHDHAHDHAHHHHHPEQPQQQQQYYQQPYAPADHQYPPVQSFGLSPMATTMAPAPQTFTDDAVPLVPLTTPAAAANDAAAAPAAMSPTFATDPYPPSFGGLALPAKTPSPDGSHHHHHDHGHFHAEQQQHAAHFDHHHHHAHEQDHGAVYKPPRAAVSPAAHAVSPVQHPAAPRAVSPRAVSPVAAAPRAASPHAPTPAPAADLTVSAPSYAEIALPSGTSPTTLDAPQPDLSAFSFDPAGQSGASFFDIVAANPPAANTYTAPPTQVYAPPQPVASPPQPAVAPAVQSPVQRAASAVSARAVSPAPFAVAATSPVVAPAPAVAAPVSPMVAAAPVSPAVRAASPAAAPIQSSSPAFPAAASPAFAPAAAVPKAFVPAEARAASPAFVPAAVPNFVPIADARAASPVAPAPAAVSPVAAPVPRAETVSPAPAPAATEPVPRALSPFSSIFGTAADAADPAANMFAPQVPATERAASPGHFALYSASPAAPTAASAPPARAFSPVESLPAAAAAAPVVPATARGPSPAPLVDFSMSPPRPASTTVPAPGNFFSGSAPAAADAMSASSLFGASDTGAAASLFDSFGGADDPFAAIAPASVPLASANVPSQSQTLAELDAMLDTMSLQQEPVTAPVPIPGLHDAAAVASPAVAPAPVQAAASPYAAPTAAAASPFAAPAPAPAAASSPFTAPAPAPVATPNSFVPPTPAPAYFNRYGAPSSSPAPAAPAAAGSPSAGAASSPAPAAALFANSPDISAIFGGSPSTSAAAPPQRMGTPGTTSLPHSASWTSAGGAASPAASALFGASNAGDAATFFAGPPVTATPPPPQGGAGGMSRSSSGNLFSGAQAQQASTWSTPEKGTNPFL